MRSATGWAEDVLTILDHAECDSMRSATANLYKNIVFLYRLHLFFWIN